MGPGEDPDERIEDTIIRRARQSQERLPMLEVVFDRMLLSLAPDLKAYCGVMPDVALESFTYATCDEALHDTASPSLLAVTEGDSWDGTFIACVEPDLLFAVLEMMLGGRSARRGSWAPRNFTSIEKRIGQRLCEIALGSLSTSFANLSPVTFNIDHMESSPQSMVLAPPSSPAVRVRLRVALEERDGHISFVIPYTAFESVRPVLSQSFLGGQLGGDSSWRNLITERLAATDVVLTAQLHELQVPLLEVMQWKPGQTIDLGVNVDQQITGICNGRTMLRGRFGQRRNGALALRVTETYLDEDDETDDDGN